MKCCIFWRRSFVLTALRRPQLAYTIGLLRMHYCPLLFSVVQSPVQIWGVGYAAEASKDPFNRIATFPL